MDKEMEIAAQRQEVRRLKDAWSEWVEARVHPTQFVTLTFSTPDGRDVPGVQFGRRAAGRFIHEAERSGIRMSYLLVEEFGERLGRIHYHGLLSHIVSVGQLKLWWPYGFVAARRIRPEGRWSTGYVTKYLAKDQHYHVGRVVPWFDIGEVNA